MRRLRTAVRQHLFLLGLAAMLALAACSPGDGKQRRSGGRTTPPPAGDTNDAGEKPPRSRLDTQKPLDVSGGNALAAPIKYAHATLRARNRTEDKIYIIEAKSAIKMFDVMNGRKPKSLDELEKWLKDEGSTLSIPARGGKYHYYPKTGDIIIYDPEDE